MIAIDWDEAIVSQALVLASRFSDQPAFATGLLGQVITSTVGQAETDCVSDGSSTHLAEVEPRRLPVVAGELHAEAFRILHELVERHGAATGVTILTGEPEQLLEQMTSMLRQEDDRPWHERQEDDRPWHELLDLVARAQMPAGLLAISRNKSYASFLVYRGAGCLVGVSASEEEHETEINVARRSLESAVVVDASTLMVTSQLSIGRGLCGRFAALVLPIAARRDLTRALIEARTLAASPGTLGWDPRRQSPIFHELSPADQQLLETRMAAMTEMAKQTIVRGATEPDLFNDLGAKLRDSPFLAGIKVAAAENAALWCDDLAVRRLAREAGVEAFGTMALVDSITEDRLAAATTADVVDEAVEILRRTVREFVSEFVVDVPAHLQDLLQQAEDDRWEPRAGGLLISPTSLVGMAGGSTGRSDATV
jgi:hypothetical protein